MSRLQPGTPSTVTTLRQYRREPEGFLKLNKNLAAFGRHGLRMRL